MIPKTSLCPTGQIKIDERTIRTNKINKSTPRHASFTPQDVIKLAKKSSLRTNYQLLNGGGVYGYKMEEPNAILFYS